MSASLYQISRRGTASSCVEMSCHIPDSRFDVVRDGNITAVMNRENDDTITSTGGEPVWIEPRGICTGGNHRSHCVWSPAE